MTLVIFIMSANAVLSFADLGATKTFVFLWLLFVFSSTSALRPR